MKSVCVYCGSNPGERPEYEASAAELGNEMVKRGLTLVYGGGSVSLIGMVTNAVPHGGSPVIGIIPKSLVRKEVSHKEPTKLHVIDSMHQRKQMMVDRANAFIAMPGGVGTYEELFETFMQLQLGYHDKPIDLLNMTSFYDKLLVLIDHVVQEGFLRHHHADPLHMSNDPVALVDMLARAPRGTVDRWSERCERT